MVILVTALPEDEDYEQYKAELIDKILSKQKRWCYERDYLESRPVPALEIILECVQ